MSEARDEAARCLRDEAQALLGLIPLLDEQFDRAVDLIHRCAGKLVVTGVGKSGHIGAKIAATLASTGTPSFFVNPLDAFHGDLGMIAPGDVVLAISNSGQTDELLRFIPSLLKRNIPLIGLSGNPRSLLARYATCHINAAVAREACPLNLAPTSSTTAQLAMGDALACALMRLRGFRSEDYARFHPGGSLGRRLLMEVRDVMRAERLPVAGPAETIRDVFIKISDGKLGLVVVAAGADAGAGDALLGIVTDGDIRRVIQKERENRQNDYGFLDIVMEDIMNRHPVTINAKAKLIDAEALFKERRVNNIIVVDDRNRLAGVLEYRECQL